MLTTPACGAGTCHFGSQTAAERSIDGILFFNESADPTHWTDAECERMLREWCEFAPRGVEADPAYLAIIARAALARGIRLPSPEFITLTYETTTRAMRRDIGRAFEAPVFQLYGATEAGVLFMECEYGRLHPNERHSHVDLVPLPGPGRLARVLVTTLGRAWMPLLRYDIGDVVRVAESRHCPCGLKSDGPLLERVEGRQSDCTDVGGATVTPLLLDDAIHEALGPEATIEQWQLSGDSLLVVDPARRREHGTRGRGRRRRAARAAGARRARRGHCARSIREVPARQALMKPEGFPLLENGYDGAPFIYLDSASTTPKPREVIAAVARYYETLGANVHRGLYPLAEAATEEYERARHRVAALIGAQPGEIVFTRNATDSFNLVARALRLGPTTRSCSPRRSTIRTICRGASPRGPCSSISTRKPCRSGRNSRASSASARGSSASRTSRTSRVS